MELPGVTALASFLRDRIGELGSTVLGRRDGVEVLPPTQNVQVVAAKAKQLATVIIGAAAPFAPNSYSRARLIRQMHASGLLSDQEYRTTTAVLEQQDPTGGAPR